MSNLSIDKSFKFIRQTATLGSLSSTILFNYLSAEAFTTHEAIDFAENKEASIAKYESISIPSRTEANSVTYQTSSLSLFLIFIVFMFLYLVANAMQDENTKKGRKKRNSSSHYDNCTSGNDNSYSFFSSDSNSSSSFYDGGGSCDSYSDSGGSSDGGCDGGDY